MRRDRYAPGWRDVIAMMARRKLDDRARLPYRSRRFDVVFSHALFEHLPRLEVKSQDVV